RRANGLPFGSLRELNYAFKITVFLICGLRDPTALRSPCGLRLRFPQRLQPSLRMTDAEALFCGIGTSLIHRKRSPFPKGKAQINTRLLN
ncbi:MAG: hypothetical protein IJY04_00625, partial [Clostridia bacterium]|nr:hypothetical protein [Clostridia bacterium]